MPDTSNLTKAQKDTYKRVVRTPRTAAEIGKPLGKSGRGVARPLNALLKAGLIVKVEGRTPKYHRA